MTNLDAGEFARLLAVFEQESQARRGRFNRFGQERQRVPGAIGNVGVLPTPKARLFFVLFYFKCYPLREVIRSGMFGVECAGADRRDGIVGMIAVVARQRVVQQSVEASVGTRGRLERRCLRQRRAEG